MSFRDQGIGSSSIMSSEFPGAAITANICRGFIPAAVGSAGSSQTGESSTEGAAWSDEEETPVDVHKGERVSSGGW